MEPFTKVNGLLKKTRRIEEVFKYGQMEADTMVSGETAWQMDKEDSFMLKVMFMKVSGLMTKPMATEYTLISTEVDMKVNGTRINNTALVLSSGQMVLNTKDNTSKV
jgi:hypothetical protein